MEFPFEYVGGGYWRARGVDRGEVAETLHGEQVVGRLEAMIGALVLTAEIGAAFAEVQQARGTFAVSACGHDAVYTHVTVGGYLRCCACDRQALEER